MQSVTSKSLSQRLNPELLRSIVQGIVTTIDGKILVASANGQSHVIHELPTNFDLGNLERNDAQTLVYSEVITTYKTHRGFSDVFINLSLNSARLMIAWVNGLSESERTQRNQIIKRSHRDF